MAFKLAILSTIFALANAGAILGGHYTYSAPQPLAYAAPAVTKVAPLAYAAPAVAKVATPVLTKHIDEEYDPNPQYSYSYDVQDSITGDNKQQQESRNGDVVQGSYSFIEADGSRRIVEYTADPLNGFNAVVHKEAGVAKVAAAAPIIAKAQPLSYVAPAPVYEKHFAYAAPAQQLIAKPLAYAAPAQLYAKPLTYAAPAPAVTYGAPLTKIIH